MSQRPKILYVTSLWPLAPAHSGAQQRVLNIGRLLRRFGDLSVVIAQSFVPDEDTVRRTQREFDVRMVVHPVPAAGGGNLFDSLSHRLRYELDPHYCATHHYTVAESDRSALLELIQEHDVIWTHTIRTANLFRINRWPRSILDMDDVLSRFYLSKAQSCRNATRRLLDLRLSRMWHLRERHFPKRFDVLTVCSEDDRHYLERSAQAHVIPNGFSEIQTSSSGGSAQLARIGFIGSLQYQPNKEGVKWFVSRVWPRVKRECPSAQLRLVGLGNDGHLATLGPDVVGLGWLEDPSTEIGSWSGMIVPITFGGGTRVKIAEGFARRCPVVSTTVGAFGYNVRDGQEILLADTPDDFASACVRLLSNPQLRLDLSARAHTCFAQRWTWDSFAGSVGAVIEECLTKNNRSRGNQQPQGFTKIMLEE